MDGTITITITTIGIQYTHYTLLYPSTQCSFNSIKVPTKKGAAWNLENLTTFYENGKVCLSLNGWMKIIYIYLTLQPPLYIFSTTLSSLTIIYIYIYIHIHLYKLLYLPLIASEFFDRKIIIINTKNTAVFICICFTPVYLYMIYISRR